MLTRHKILVARNKGYSVEYNMNQNSLSNEIIRMAAQSQGLSYSENQSDHKLKANIIITYTGQNQYFIKTFITLTLEKDIKH